MTRGTTLLSRTDSLGGVKSPGLLNDLYRGLTAAPYFGSGGPLLGEFKVLLPPDFH